MNTPYEEFHLGEALTDVGDVYGHFLVHRGCESGVRLNSSWHEIEDVSLAEMNDLADVHWRVAHGGAV